MILRALFSQWRGRRKKSAEPAGDGCLFGLTPPPGCFFAVSLYKGDSWHVRIVRGARDVAHECVLIRGEHKSDAELITEAARKALLTFEKVERRSHLEGCYPPKRVSR